MSTHDQNHLRKHDQPRCPGEICADIAQTKALSLVHTIPMYAPVRPGSL